MREIINGLFVTRGAGEDMPGTPEHARRLMAGMPDDRMVHDQYFQEVDALHFVERGARPLKGEERPEAIRIAAWNLERCVHAPASAALLAHTAPDVTFLSEMDVGMARSGQLHTPRSLASRMGHEFHFGVEFLELGLGSKLEKERFDGKSNRHGFHGNVLTSAYTLKDPILIRFDRDATWFGVDCVERRIGGRMALAAKLPMAGGELVLVSVHLESRCTSERRAMHMEKLLKVLEDYAPGAPMVMGGDLNTDSDAWSLSKGTQKDSEQWLRLVARTKEPAFHEPLFEVVKNAGFDWDYCNVLEPSVRETEYSGPRNFPDLKLDWFFTRGVVPANPDQVPATDDNGHALSDHEMITVDVALA